MMTGFKQGLLAAVLAASPQLAEDADPRLRMDEITPGSYAVLSEGYPDSKVIRSYVFAGKSGDYYRMQVFDGHFPNGPLLETHYLSVTGGTVAVITHRKVGKTEFGGAGSDRFDAGQKTTGYLTASFFTPQTCRRTLGTCHYWTANGDLPVLAGVAAVERVPGNEVVHELSVAETGFAWVASRPDKTGALAPVSSGVLELDEKGFIKRELIRYPNRTEVWERLQIEAVYY